MADYKNIEGGVAESEALFYGVKSDFSKADVERNLRDNNLILIAFGVSEDNFGLYLTQGMHDELVAQYGSLDWGGEIRINKNGETTLLPYSATLGNVPKDKEQEIVSVISQYLKNDLGVKFEK